LDCSPSAAPTLDDLARRIRAAAAAGRARSWLRGAGFDDAFVAERRPPDRSLLDAVSPTRPIVVHHAAGTVAYCNTLALRLLGVDPSRDDGTRGVERDAAGSATGTVEKHTGVLEGVPYLAGADLARAWDALASDLVAMGVTAVTDATVANGPDELAVLAALGERTPGPAVGAMVGAAALTAPAFADAALHELRVRHAKIVVESDEPEDLDALVAGARRYRLGAAVHVTDIDGLDRALHALGAAGTAAAGAGDRLEHVSLCLPEQVGQIAAAGVGVVTQPAFMAERREKYAELLSDVEQEWLYRLGSLLAAGVAVAASSDSPVVQASPLASMAAAMVSLNPGERVDAAVALRLVTCAAAAASGLPGGVLTPGAPGDLVVLGADPLACGPAELVEIPVLATVIGGRVVHAAAELGW
ncbi:MAG TPA: amidohydrolase family protein, partial [Acidimicrobiales bacterium]|nr:amidohydrolase family protein [Acidimicrobiales bacterium]